MATYVDPLKFSGVGLTAGNSVGTGERSTTTNTMDPFQRLLYEQILNSVQGPQGQVQQYTKDALQRTTENPAVSAGFFNELAQPLVQSLDPFFKQQGRNQDDAFRRAGAGTFQSGAFANAKNALAGQQQNQVQQLLAQNYVPLTGQLANTQMEAINAGLRLPEAENTTARTLSPLAASIKPASSTTEAINIAPNVPSADKVLGTSAAQNQQQMQDWWKWFNG